MNGTREYIGRLQGLITGWVLVEISNFGWRNKKTPTTNQESETFGGMIQKEKLSAHGKKSWK